MENPPNERETGEIDRDNETIHGLQESNRDNMKGLIITEMISDAEFVEMFKAKQKEKLGRKFIIHNTTLKYYFTRFSRRIFSNQNCAKTIDLKIQRPAVEESRIPVTICETLKFSKCLQYLRIDLTNQNKISDSQLKTISRNLAFMPSLQCFRLYISDCPNVTDRGLGDFGQHIKTLQRLKEIHLSIGWNDKITDFGISTLGQSLKHLKTLESLSLDVTKCPSLTIQGLLWFALNTIPLSNLRNIHYNFLSNPNRDDSGTRLKDFGATLACFPYLGNLALNFRKCKDIAGMGLSKLSECFDSLGNLEAITLGFDSCETDDQEVSIFCQHFSNLLALKNISLDMEGNLITDTSFECLGKSLESLKYLTNLLLNFSCCIKLTDLGLIAFSRSLRKLESIHSIKELNLSFEQSFYTDRGICFLSESLAFFTGLEVLELRFSSCQFVTDKSLISLAQSLSSLKSLQAISLNYFSCNEITDEGFAALCQQGLFDLKDLKKISFMFSTCRNLTDKSLECFAQTLWETQLLQEIILDFSYCQNLTMLGLMALGKSLLSLKDLQFLNLELLGCWDITPEAVRGFKRMLGANPNLQKRVFGPI